MSVELRPLGVACNIACRYCYQQQQRQAGNGKSSYDLELMKAAVLRQGGPFTLFGGEALLLHRADLEELLRWGHERFGSSAVQTNGVLLDAEHVRLFREYNVHVGISIDGPGELNDLRWHRSAEQTRRSTAATEQAIELLCREHRPPGLIVTLHRMNAVGERLRELLAWAAAMDDLGVRSMRLHLLESESEEIRRAYGLSERENVDALLAFAALQPRLRGLRFDVLDEMERALRGRDEGTSCVWHACDPYTTPAVRGVEGLGQSSNCGRTNKDGVDFIKADRGGYERYLALHQTPQEDGGCRGCRFFLVCKGQCPGTAIDGDWRNRSELCGVWLELFARLERTLVAAGVTPVSLHPDRQWLEDRLAALWRQGRSSTIAGLLQARRRQGASSPVVPSRLRNRVRLSFVGAPQRLTWEPRIERARSAESTGALEAVAAEDVAVGRARVSDGALFGLHARAAERGLHLLDLGVAPAGQFHEVALGRYADVESYRRAAEAGDAAAAARLEGVPPCCAAAAARRAETGASPLWAYAAAGADLPYGVADVRCDPLANPFLRATGIAFLAHVPCAPGCEPSLRLAERRRDLARAADEGAADAAAAILAWPLEWSSLHALVEIKTGIFRLVHPDDYSRAIRRVRYWGPALAPDAAFGLGFAFRERGRPSTSAPRLFNLSRKRI